MSSIFESEQARRYARIRYRLLLVDLLATLLFLWGYQRLGCSAAVAHWAAQTTAHFSLQLVFYLLVFGVVQYAIFLPLHVYRDFFLEHLFGLSRLTLAGWLVREAKRLALSGVFGLFLMEGFYGILRVWPQQWTWIATAGWVLVSVVIARIFPTVLLPIFYKTTPLTEQVLTDRLLALCQQVGLPALGVFRVDLGAETRKANAALAGLGKTRRVLLSDTLLEQFSPEEIETVLAHELGHQRYRHIAKSLVLITVGSWIAFLLIDRGSAWWMRAMGLRGLADLAGFPMLMLVLSMLGLVGLPLQNGLSRHFEWQADHFAVATTKAPHVFAAALLKLGTLNLADPAPPAWVEICFYDHPAIRRRIAVAESAAV